MWAWWPSRLALLGATSMERLNAAVRECGLFQVLADPPSRAAPPNRGPRADVMTLVSAACRASPPLPALVCSMPRGDGHRQPPPASTPPSAPGSDPAGVTQPTHYAAAGDAGQASRSGLGRRRHRLHVWRSSDGSPGSRDPLHSNTPPPWRGSGRPRRTPDACCRVAYDWREQTDRIRSAPAYWQGSPRLSGIG